MNTRRFFHLLSILSIASLLLAPASVLAQGTGLPVRAMPVQPRGRQVRTQTGGDKWWDRPASYRPPAPPPAVGEWETGGRQQLPSGPQAGSVLPGQRDGAPQASAPGAGGANRPDAAAQPGSAVPGADEPLAQAMGEEVPPPDTMDPGEYLSFIWHEMTGEWLEFEVLAVGETTGPTGDPTRYWVVQDSNGNLHMIYVGDYNACFCQTKRYPFGGDLG